MPGNRPSPTVRKAFEAAPTVRNACGIGRHQASIRLGLGRRRKEYRRMLEMNPSFVTTRKHLFQMLAARGRFDQATDISEETMRIDPQSIGAVIAHGMVLYLQARLGRSGEDRGRVLAEDPGNPASICSRRGSLRRVAAIRRVAVIKQAWQLSAEVGATLQDSWYSPQALPGDVLGRRPPE